MTESRRSPPDPVTTSRALREFFAAETVGGVVLVVAAVAALVWVNSPWGDGYQRLWHTDLGVSLGSWTLSLDLRHWINEGLMAIFFFVVGLEVKREFFEGELRDPRRAALPVIAAVGGMVVPALLYLLINTGALGERGWGIPMATDIAFALGVAALLGRRLPSSLRLFLLTLAIVDDIGAIAVIAVFYSSGIAWQWLAAAVAIVVIAYVLRRANVAYTPMFIAIGCALWLVVYESGVHATLAGVAMGFLAPTQPTLSQEAVTSRADELLDVSSAQAARTTAHLARLSVSRLEWLLHSLHPWTSFLIVPLFALANAGVPLSMSALEAASSSTVAWGVLVGLVVGKPLGITVLAWASCRLGLASLPDGVRWSQLAGVAALGGIGFTVSIFVAGLAFTDPALGDAASVGILASALMASLLGAGILLLAGRRSTDAGSRSSP